jgi:hypothetical protein
MLTAQVPGPIQLLMLFIYCIGENGNNSQFSYERIQEQQVSFPLQEGVVYDVGWAALWHLIIGWDHHVFC